MILILGLVILLAAVVVGVAGVFGNTGAGHQLTSGGDFSLFGYHATGSTGSLFLTGIIVGAVGLLGLALVMAGARRSARRSARARRDRGAARREPVTDDRGDAADGPRDDMGADGARSGAAGTPRSRLGHWLGRRTAHH
ncbi:hypothetical protein [Streptomyces sp. NRRL F-2664]|uniref:hypothetical protein n=1 Tax=Streptomyces sp. NRRL F-2664 TaxID=1463842 RepID=UPI00068D4495|nr:hypothetical protein [Streptomyces sp. NRRL F-2664]